MAHIVATFGRHGVTPTGPPVSALAGFGAPSGAIVNLATRGQYLHWGFILISVANLVIIVVMVTIFVLALLVPFVHAHRNGSSGTVDPVRTPADAARTAPLPEGAADPAATEEDTGLWTAKLRRAWLRHLPPDKLLPDSQPAYVASWVYVFGVLTLMGLAVVIASGTVLALEGPVWWHTSSVGLFVNSLHLWSVECFFGFMAVHLWGKYWMASWRGNRQLTWMTGVVAFLVAVFEGFTGYISQTNFDSQWIAFEAKDAMNSAGIGAFFNTMNFGQTLMLHIVVLPLVIVLVVVVHIVMVRLRGVAPPIDALPEHLGEPEHLGGAEPAPPAASAFEDPPASAVSSPSAPPSRPTVSTSSGGPS